MKKRVFSLALVLCMMLALVPSLGLTASAEEYTTYEYVRTTGLQYINLGITTNDLTGAQVKFSSNVACCPHTGVNYYLLGGYDYYDYDGDGKMNALRWSVLTLTEGGKFGFQFPSTAQEAESMYGSLEAFGIDTPIDYEVVIRNGYQKVVRGDTEKTSNKSIYNTNFRGFDLYLGCGSGTQLGASDASRTTVDKATGLPRYGWPCQIYSFKIFKDDISNASDTENSNMTMDLVAAKNSAGKIGLLNKVDGKFLAFEGKDLDKLELGAETGKTSGATGGSTTPASTVPATGTAYASKQSVDLDGKATTFDMYMLVDANGGETNYIKLRDIAYLLSGTAAQFEVGYDGTISLTTGKAYTPNGSELMTPFSGARAYKVCDTTIKVNGSVPALAGITLTDDAGGEYNYFKLRDLGTALGFKVDWSAERGIFVATK